MPIIYRWDDNLKSTIYVQFYGEWSWDDLTLIRKTILEMIEDLPHIVDYVADLRYVEDFPYGALAVGRSIHKSRVRNEGVAVIVGASPMLRMLYQSFTVAFPASKNESILVQSLDDAYKILAEIQENRSNQ